MFNSLINKWKNKLAIRLQPTIQKLCGIKGINEQIESIYYILNHGMDIRRFPKATGLLRQVQLADTELLRIFHGICEKHNLRYWLDGGTLLGAIRHEGFIPWDDDLDVSMPREDYNGIMDILRSEFCNSSMFEVYENGFIRIEFWKAGVALDIFAMDNVSNDYVSSSEELSEKIKKYVDYIKANTQLNNPISDYNTKREEIIGKPSLTPLLYYRQQEFFPSYKNSYSFIPEDIFPLKKIIFEDLYYFNIPNNYSKFLEYLYGEYMHFPKSGMLHHKEDGVNIFQNSKKFNCDIENVLEILKNM